MVLFDEIEKAHRDIFQMLLQILEDGVLSDAKGRKVDFSNSIVILTSNLGADRMQREVSLGFSGGGDKYDVAKAHEQTRVVALEALKDAMRPELLARFDDILVFNAMTRPVVG